VEITVVIPTYNRYVLLKRAITSLYSQTYKPKEIIVVDDGSMDDTSKIQNDFPEILYIYQANRGVSAARNVGIQRASCDWIAFLDSDDEFHPEKLQKQVEFHQENSNILMSYTAENWIRNGKEVKIPKKYRKIGKDAFVENLSYCNIAPSSVLLHKNILDDVGLFDENLEVCEDYDMWLRITQKYEAGLINEKLINKYAGHAEQLGFRKNMDKIRINILEKLMKNCEIQQKKELLQRELNEKKSIIQKLNFKEESIAQ